MWTEQWSYNVNGVELNDHVNFECVVPQLDDIPSFDIHNVPIDGTYPAFVRADPTPGIFTFLITIRPGNAATYATRKAMLEAAFVAAPIPFIHQARGEAVAVTHTIVPRGRAIDYKTRQVVYDTYVPFYP